MSRDSGQPRGGTSEGTPEDESTAGDSGVDSRRRRLLASGAATWATVGLAGCPGGGGGDTDTPAGTEPPTDTPTESPTEPPASPTPTDTPEPQPENYVVTTETWNGSQGMPNAVSFMSSCERSSKFLPGTQLVFFVGIYDPATGERLGPDSLDGVAVNVGDGMQTLELEWTDSQNVHTRADGNDWVGTWMIPEDMEAGEYGYTVEVSNGDANFQNVGVLNDGFEVVEYDDPTNYVVDTETRWNGGPDQLPEYTNGFVGTCAPEREFTPEMDVTFVVGIYDSTSGNMVGADGVVDPTSGEAVEDEGSEAGSIDSVTVVSPNGEFSDLSLEWTSAVDDENGLPRWFATLETEDLDPGTYAYEVQISNESEGRFDVGIAADQFTIIEIPSS